MSLVGDLVEVANSITTFITSTVIVPLLIFFTAVILGKIIHVLLRSFLESVEFDKHAKKVFTHKAEYADLISGGVAIIIYTVGVIWALVEAGIIVLALQIVGGFLGVIACIALVIWGIDLLPNLVAYRAVIRKWSVGQNMSVSGVKGTVQSFGWLSVTITTPDSMTVVIPHRTVKSKAEFITDSTVTV